MPVPSSLNDLSTTPSLNSPAGSESPALVDDYIRTHAAFIKQVNDESVKTSGNQTIAGTKTFSSAPVVPGLSDSGNLTFTGTGNRITGDFSNATIANRVAFQTSTANAATTVNVLPNGAATTAQLAVWNNADPTNGSTLTLSAQAAETRVSSGAAGSGTLLPLTFYTNNAERMRIDTSGNVLVTNNTGGLGYGTGAGGSVTQSTSKSTAVTLNRPTGQITMNNAALAANTEVAFVFNNSLLTVADIVLVQINNSGNYQVRATDQAAGNVTIRVRNLTAGSLSDSPLINFAIIKGATS